MKKLIGAVAAGIFLFAGVASAATISNPLFSNGQTTIDAAGGATVSGTFTLTVGPGEVVEWLRNQADTQPFTDTSVGGTLGYQEGVYTNVPFSAKVSPNTGTYNVYVQGAGTYGGNRSINGGDNVTVGSTNVGQVRVVTSGGDTTTGGAFGGLSLNDLKAWIAAAVAAALPAPAPTPTVSADCAAYAKASAGAVMGTTNAANGRLQGFLIGEGMSIPLLQSNQAPYGFYGTQTAGAVASFQAAFRCN